MKEFFKIYFNSIKVQLEPVFEVYRQVFHKDFNSIKVQLEPGSHSRNNQHKPFQFHKGTIRTRRYLEGSWSFPISIP